MLAAGEMTLDIGGDLFADISLAILAICRESTREQDEKYCSSKRARPDGVRRLGAKRVSSQLFELPRTYLKIAEGCRSVISAE
jgi:hypothetical protein